ncbi:MAG: hypothetical protein OXF41_13880 [bacterium]|nr:hypothetical protein [bacterium]
MAQRERPRFFDSRAAYMMFVTTTTEKTEVAARIAREAALVDPGPYALRVFDAGMGDATVLTDVMRNLHASFTHVPWLVVGKEISLEDVRLALEKLPDRFHEHPELVFAATNMTYREAPDLRPGGTKPEVAWRTTALEGSTTVGFARQIRATLSTVIEDWEVRTSPKTGNPIYVRPAVHVLYRKDREFILRQVLPELGRYQGTYDLIIASQPYRARTSAEHKVRTVIRPLSRAIAPGGRLLGIHSYGHDPGIDIIRNLWPDENPFWTDRHALLAEAAHQLAGPDDRGLVMEPLQDCASIFRYSMRPMAVEAQEHIATPSILAAWNAAAYVAQIDEQRMAGAVESGAYIEATRSVIERHGGVWFNNESYVIHRVES